MLRFIDFISEAYDFSKNETTSSSKTHNYHFSDGDRHYRVQITHSPHKDGGADVSFATIDHEGKTNARKTDAAPGKSHKIFSTVHNIMKHHAEKHGIDRYSFSASGKEPSRQKLYDRLAKKHGGGLADIDIYGNHHYIANAK